MKAFSFPREELQEGLRLDIPYNQQVKHNQRLEGSKYKWRKLEDITLDICDGPRGIKLTRTGIPYLKLGNLGRAEIHYDDTTYVAAEEIKSRYQLAPGDVLLSKIGNEPRAALVQEDLYGATYSSDLYRLRVDPKKISPIWLEIFLNSKYLGEVINQQNYGSALRRLSAFDLRNIYVPIPSLELSSRLENLEAAAQEFSVTARNIFDKAIQGLFAELDQRINVFEINGTDSFVASNQWLFERWDVSYVRGRKLVQDIEESKLFKPLRDLARIPVSSRKHLDPNQEICYVKISDIDPEFMTFGTVHQEKLSNLSERIRLPLHEFQVLVLVSGSNLGSDSHPIAVVEPHLDGCLTSNAFIALEFRETPIYFGLILRHPLVLSQMQALSSGTVISFISKREIGSLLLPVLGSVWREDFNDRAQIAWEKRSRAIQLRQKAINLVDDFIKEALG